MAEKKPAKKPKNKKPKKEPKSKKEPPQKKEKESRKVIVEIEKKEKECDETRYVEKLKHLLFKIKNQHTNIDSGIRFAWKNN